MDNTKLFLTIETVSSFYDDLGNSAYEYHLEKKIAFSAMLHCYIGGDTSDLRDLISLSASKLADNLDNWNDVVTSLGIY